MHFRIQQFIISLTLLVSIPAFSQEPQRALVKRVIVKTNILSLLAQRPTITVEKTLGRKFSAEISFVEGQFNNLLLTDHYDYNGFLLRFKRYFRPLDFGAVNPYAAVYAGNLKRNIQTTGQTDNSGWFGYPSRDFSANSIRSGVSFGLCYFPKSKIIFDGQASLGYGRYLKLNKKDSNTYNNGYLDAQVWLSIGYAF